jgi:hypothetical protein
MRVRFGSVPALVFGAVFALAAVKTANASAIYSYNGDPMVYSYGLSSPLDGAALAISFTLPAVLPPDFGNRFGPLSFEISVATDTFSYTLTDQTPNLEQTTFFIETDGADHITDFAVEVTGPIDSGQDVLTLLTEPMGDDWATCPTSTYLAQGWCPNSAPDATGGMAIYTNNQPSWTVTDLDPSSTPEASTSALSIAGGLILLAAAGLKSRSGRHWGLRRQVR